MKMMKKLSVLLLSFGMMLMLTAPALAVPSESFAVLNVKYTPNGRPQNGIEISLCKVADAVPSGEGYTYTLTGDFADFDIDLNAILGGKQVTDPETNSKTNRQLLRQFGEYINARASGDEPVEKFTATTANMAIGTGSESSDGVAQFTGLEDGLYLGYTNTVTTFDRTQYTAVPFLLNIPYEVEGVVNNYITATLKFTTYTPTRPGEPEEPDEPVTPPTITDEPNSPGPGPGPSGPVTPVTIDPAPVPAAEPVEEPVIDILPEEVPLASLPEEELPVEIEIPDAEVPLANLPQTGLLWWPVPLMASAGVACVGLGAYTKKRDRDA